jgi:hypothetical protein
MRRHPIVVGDQDGDKIIDIAVFLADGGHTPILLRGADSGGRLTWSK